MSEEADGDSPDRGAPHPYLILQTDGAARGNPGPAALGAVAMDPQSGEVFAVGRALGAATNNVAEYSAVVEALRMAQRLGASRVLLEADSELLIRQLEGRYKVKSANLLPLFEECADLLKTFDDYRLRHIPREQNGMADGLANRALDAQKRQAR